VSSTSGIGAFVDNAARVGRWLENALLGVLLVSMILLATTQILLRDFGGGSLVWGDEAIRLMVLWLAIIGGIAAAREDRHISIDVLSRFLSAKARFVSAVIVDLFTIAVCLALAWYGWQMVSEAFEYDDELLGGLPAWIFQAVIPAGFLCMAWRYFIWLLKHAKAVFAGEVES